MTPDRHMPFYWLDFWDAVEGWDDRYIVGYQRALSYYWHTTNCQGLKDNAVFLRKICRIDEAHWPEFRDLAFDGDRFFKRDRSGMWRQKRADIEWQIRQDSYDEAVERGKGRWKGTSKEERSEIARRAVAARWKKSGGAAPG